MTAPTKSDCQAALSAHPYATHAELGKLLGVPKRRVGPLLKKHGLRTARSRQRLRVARADLENLLDRFPGMGARDLAEYLGGVSHETVARSIQDHGLVVDRSHASKKRVKDAFAAGATTPYKMARRLDITERQARNWMEHLALIENGSSRAAVRATLPACRVCGDPVSADPVWGGEGDLHYLCAAHEGRRGTIVYHKWSGEDE